MLTLKKVKELVEAPSHAKRTPSPKMLFEEGIVLLRREFDQGSHLTVYNSGYVLFSAGKRNTVFHIHDCCGDYAYDAAEGKGDVIEEEYFENCEWHIRALFEGERKMEDNQAKCEGAGRSNVCVSYHALSEDWSEIADRTINMLEKIIENEAVHAMLAVLTDKQRDLIHQQFVLGKTHQEIADDIGMSRGSVTRAVNQALERIRRKFDFEAHYELAAGGFACSLCGKILPQIVNLLIQQLQVGIGGFGGVAGIGHFDGQFIARFFQILVAVVAVLLHIDDGICHLLQIRNFDFLSIGATLLGFYAVLQIHHQTEIRFDIENGNGVSNAPFLFFFCGGDRVAFKKCQKMFAVKTGSQSPGRYVFLSVRQKITESASMVFYQNVGFGLEQAAEFFKRFCFLRRSSNGIAQLIFLRLKFGFHGSETLCNKLSVQLVQIDLPALFSIILLLRNFVDRRGKQIDLIEIFPQADIHKRLL